MVNPYPYFTYTPNMASYALFKRNAGIRDRYTGLRYTNMFDAMMDAMHSAMKASGYGDVNIVVGETGWPTSCDGYVACSLKHASLFNGHLVRHVNSRRGTPLMPNRRFETYLFSMFNENLKPGPNAERNWGIFQPDFTPIYDAGLLRRQVWYLCFILVFIFPIKKKTYDQSWWFCWWAMVDSKILGKPLKYFVVVVWV